MQRPSSLRHTCTSVLTERILDFTLIPRLLPLHCAVHYAPYDMDVTWKLDADGTKFLIIQIYYSASHNNKTMK